MTAETPRSNAYTIGTSDERPWGSWHVLDVGDGYAVKRIYVQPGGQLSLQRHQYRSEHWTLVQGRGRIRIGDDVMDLGPNQSVYIPLGALHRIENTDSRDLVFIEVQCGDVLDEDDIERIEDAYGRINGTGASTEGRGN